MLYQTKVRNLRDTKPKDWWREVKQLCGTSKPNKKGLKDSLHQVLCQETDKTLCNKINNSFINVMKITFRYVKIKLREVKTSRSRGPDDILNWVLKTFSDILALPIMDIINTSFRSSKVPDIWKLADVVPLPKVPIVQDLEK